MDKPKGTDQYNFTDPESRIMKVGNHEHFEQSYNAQAAVEVKSYLIAGQRVSPSPNDKQELVPTLAAIPAPVGAPEAVLIDSGFLQRESRASRRAQRCRSTQRHDCICGDRM